MSWVLGGDKTQPAAPLETFARFQLAAIIDSLMLVAVGWLAGWMTGCLTERKMDNGWLLFAEMEDCNNVLQHARRSGEVGGFYIIRYILRIS